MGLNSSDTPLTIQRIERIKYNYLPFHSPAHYGSWYLPWWVGKVLKTTSIVELIDRRYIR